MTLLIGKGDWDVLTSLQASGRRQPALFTRWISGGGTVETVRFDTDVFRRWRGGDAGDARAYPGHHSMLVRLPQMGPVLLTGDLTHFRENDDGLGVPVFNTNRAETMASLARFKKIAANLKATVVIEHDLRDVGKLPAFPAAAR